MFETIYIISITCETRKDRYYIIILIIFPSLYQERAL